VSDLSGKLSSVIHAALLANGVQLTGKELSPVSVTVAGYVRDNFEGVTKSVNEELTVLKKQKAEAESLVKQSAPVVPVASTKVQGTTNAVPDAVESNVYRGPVSGEPFTGSATSSTLKPPPPPGGRAK
jgi:hypothetical protein